MEGYSTDPCDLDKAPSATLFSSSDDFHAYLKKDPGCDIRAVPSDASNGCFLGAINVTLNLLEKHYMDRWVLIFLSSTI